MGGKPMKVQFLISVAMIFFLIGYCQAAEKEASVSEKCINCHKELNPGLYNQWAESKHAKNEVTCMECHGAEKEDPDAFTHEGAIISTLVTPKDCGECHDQQAKEVGESHHAKAGLILESQDAYLANVTAGTPAAISGCEWCHGSKVQIDEKSPNKIAKISFPNSGVGRLNPDGSKGACNACHLRHAFSKAQARQPETCSKCHLGPDHPQKEIYEESKHGNAYYTNRETMNMKSDEWVVGVDYFGANTCATCHISATKKQKVNHDVGQRIAWTLRPVISVNQENWQQKRENMKDVCSACHAKAFVEGNFYQYDATVKLYNEKFAKPATEIMELVNKQNVLNNKASFSNKIEWVYFEVWHHEGRRARHGAAMMGPDYTWWHGFYEVARNFYFEFLPEAREYNNAEINAYIDNLLKDPMHKWMMESTDNLKNAIRSGAVRELYKKFFEGI
jgi:hydroxylamine dehydrogenase